jgi:hypothetical protein
LSTISIRQLKGVPKTHVYRIIRSGGSAREQRQEHVTDTGTGDIDAPAAGARTSAEQTEQKPGQCGA